MLRIRRNGHNVIVQCHDIALSLASVNNLQEGILTSDFGLGVRRVSLLAWSKRAPDGDIFAGSAYVSAALRLMADFLEAESEADAIAILRNAGRRKGVHREGA